MFERYCLKRLTFSPNVFLETILQRMPETVHVRKDSKIISSVFGKDPEKDTPGKGGV